MAIFSSKYTGSFETTASFGRIDIEDNVKATSFTGIFEGALSSSAQISDDISGSFVAPSSSFSTRITTEEVNVDALQVDSGSFSTRITTEEANVDALQADSASFSTRVTQNSQSLADRITSEEENVAALQADSSSFSTRTTTLETTMVAEQANIDNLQADSASFSTRVTDVKTRITTEEGNVDTLQAREIISGVGISGGGDLTADRTLNIDFSDSTFQTGISGSFTALSSSFSTRIGTEEANVDALQADSASFSTRVTNLKTDSGSFSTRVSTNESFLNQSVKSDASPTFAGLRVDGRIVTQELFVSSSVVSMSVRQASGSTIFGDDLTDTHLFTGSLDVTGSLKVGGLNVLTGSSQIADNISGSFTAPSSSFSTRTTVLETASASFSTRITTEEDNVDDLQARQIIGGVGLKDGGDLTADRTLNIDFSDSTFASGISGSFTADSASLSSRITTTEAASASFSTRITTEEANVDDLQNRGLTAGVGLIGGGNLTADRTFDIDFGDATFASGISGSLGPNAATIRSLTKAGISGSFTQASASFSTRITTEEGNVDTLQARNIDTGLGLTGGGDLTSDRTLAIDFSDSTFASGISGSFTSTSASIASDIKEFKDGTVTLVSGSGASTGSFGKLFGDGSDLTGVGGFPFTGSAGIKGSLIVDGKIESNASISGSTISASSIQATTIDIDSIDGNWTNAGNTVADLGTITTVDINGGTIDGTTIATSNINVTGQTLTLDDNQISGDKVEGGTINATTINTLTSTTIKDFTNASGSSVSTGSFGKVETTKVKTTEIKFGGTDISATATEINFLSGVTSDVKEAYDTVSYATDTGIITFTEIDGGTDTIDIGVGTGDSPSFTGLTVSGLTNSKLLGVNGSGVVGEKDLNDFVTGTTNRISVADDSDGTITLSTPQDIATTSNVTFNHITGSGNISGSGTSTGSFGKLKADFGTFQTLQTKRFRGFSPIGFDDGINLTGSIDFKDGDISGSAASTGSFGRVFSADDIELGGNAIIFNTATGFVTNAGGAMTIQGTGNVVLDAGAGADEVTLSTTALTSTVPIIVDGNVSGSSTSTGSFGALRIGDNFDSPAHFADDLVIGRSGNAGLTIRSDSANGYIAFADGTGASDAGYRGQIQYLHSTDKMLLITSGQNRALIDSSAIEFPTANYKISGSATSTGSFGTAVINDKLGIGTNVPNRSLTIVSDASAAINLDSSNNSFIHIDRGAVNDVSEIAFRTDGSNIFSMGLGNSSNIGDGTDFFIGTGSGGSGNVRFLINSSGKVGVGTASPNKELEVYKASEPRIRVTSGTGGNPAYEWAVDDDRKWVFYSAQSLGTNTMYFKTNTLNVMMLTQAGDVGIGNDTPSFKLDVSGTGRFTGNLTLGGNIVGDNATNISGVNDITALGDVSGSATSTGSFGSVFVKNQSNLQFGSINTRIRGDNSNNVLTFMTNNTERVRINDNGVGIGGDPVSGNGLTIHAANPGLTLRASNTTGACKIRFADTGDADIGKIEYGHNTNAMIFNTADAEAFRLDTNQNAIFGGSKISGSASSTGSFGHLNIHGNAIIGGTITAQEFRTEFINDIVIETSGSTKFGNSSDDTHQFTGSVNLDGKSTSGVATPFEVIGGTGTSAGGLKFGAYDANFGGIWPAGVTPAASNYALVARGTRTVINATTDIGLYKDDSTVLLYANSDGVAIGGNSLNPGYKLDITGTGRFTSDLTLGGNIVGDDATNISGINNITALGNISSSSTSTGSFGKLLGDGSDITGISTTPFPFTGSAGISGSFKVTNQGRELFNVLDNFNSENSGSDQILFNVNTIAGVPIFQAEASRSRVIIGGASGLETFFKPNGHYIIQSSSPVSASFEDIVLNGSNIHDVFINEGDIVGFPFTASHAGGPAKAGIQGPVEITGSILIETDSANSGSSLFRVKGNHGNLLEAIDDKNIGLFRVPNLIGFDALHIDKNSNITFDNGVNPQVISGSAFSTGSFGRLAVSGLNIIDNNAFSIGLQSGVNRIDSAGGGTDVYRFIDASDNITGIRIASANVSDKLFLKTDGSVSGSSTSTGSFGYGIYDGNVGIGTTNTFGRRLTIEAAADTTNDQLLYLKQTPDNYGWSFNINGSQTGTLHIKNVANGTESDVLMLKQNGNVGVGSTNPSVALDVTGQINASTNIVAMTALYGNELITRSGNTLTFKTAGGTAIATLTNTGRVGIGTTSPGYPLVVNKTESAASDFITNLDLKRTWSGGTSTDRLHGLIFSDFNSVNAGIFVNRYSSGANYNSHLEFYTNGGSSNMTPATALSTPKMVITYNGNVGIGQTSPSHKLDVDGTGRFTGNLRTDSVLQVGGNNDFLTFTSSTYVINDGDDSVFTRIKGYDNTTDMFFGENTITFKGNLSGSGTSTGSFGRIQASSIGGNSPLIVEADNFTIDASGTFSGSATSTGSFGKLNAPVTIPAGRSLRTSKIRGRSPVAVDTNDTNMNITGSLIVSGSTGNIELSTGKLLRWNNGDAQIRAVSGYNFVIETYTGSSMTEKLRVTSGGNVGINDTDPSEKLSVTGNIKASGNISGSATSTGSFGAGYIDNKLGIGTTSPGMALDIKSGEFEAPASSGNATNGIARFGQASGDGALDIGFHDSGDGYSWLQSRNSTNYAIHYHLALQPIGKNVGIGNVSPAHKLDVTGTGRFTGTLTTAAITTTGITSTGNISGSATSTGSFGSVRVREKFELAESSDTFTLKDLVNSRTYFSATTGAIITIGQNYGANINLNTSAGVIIPNGTGLNVQSGNISGSSTSTGSFGNIVVGKGAGKLQLHANNASGLNEFILIRPGGTSSVFSGIGLGDNNGYLTIFADRDDASTSGIFFQVGGSDQLTVLKNKISGSATSTGSFGKLLGDGSEITGISTTPFPFTGSAGISGSLNVKHLTAATGSTMFSVDGSEGTLFSVVNSMTGSIFSANTVAGIPVIEALSNGDVNIGPSGSSFSRLFVNGGLITVSPNATDGSQSTISGSGVSTGSFGTLKLGGGKIQGNTTIGGTLTIDGIANVSASIAAGGSGGSGTGFPFTGSAGLSGSLEVKHLGAATGSTMFSVQASEGTLFSVVNSMTGSIFSANTVAGIPVMEAFSDGKVEFGPLTSVITGSKATASFGKLIVGGTEVTPSPITALNNKSANRLVTIGSTTTELDGEANLTFNGTNLAINTYEISNPNAGTVTFNAADEDITTVINGVGGASNGGSFTVGDSKSFFTSQKVGIGSTNPGSNLTIQTTSGTISAASAPNASLSFGSISSTLTPTIMGRQTNSNQMGLYLLSATANTNQSGDMEFNVRENDNTTFSTLTNSAFKFSHYTTDLVDILRNGNVGIGTTSPEEKLHVDGNIRATGDIIAERYIVSSSVSHITSSFSSGSTIFGDTTTDTHRFTGSLFVTNNVNASAFIEQSSMRYKENIETLESPLEKISKLRGVSYNLIENKEPSIGMIAEEVNEIFPELVSKDDSGEVQSMSYTRMTAVLLEAVKELTKEVKELKKSNIYYKNKDK